MISRFNLDQKRLNFYEDNKKFNEEFNLLHKDTNSEQKSYEIEKPSVLINGENSLKISLIKNDKEFKYILFSHHSDYRLPLKIAQYQCRKLDIFFQRHSFLPCF